MASKTEKTLSVAKDIEKRLNSGELPEYSPRYKTVVMPYSWERHKSLSEISDINEVGKFYDFLISEKLGIEVVPRIVVIKGYKMPNRERPPFMYLNLSRISDFLDRVDTDESRRMSKVIRMCDVRNPSIEYAVNTIKESIDTVLNFSKDSVLDCMSADDLRYCKTWLNYVLNDITAKLNERSNPEPEETTPEKPFIEPVKEVVDLETSVDMELARLCPVVKKTVTDPPKTPVSMPRYTVKKGRVPEKIGGRYVLYGKLEKGESVLIVYSSDIDGFPMEIYGKMNGNYTRLIWSKNQSCQ